MDLYEELLRVLDRLEAAQVEYALCGGIAVAFHGYPRFTKDIDLLIQASELDQVRQVLGEQGFVFDAGRLPFGVGGPQERILYRLSKIEGADVLSVDLVLVSPVLDAVWQQREIYEWQGRQVCVVSAQGLARMKRLAGRPQDRLDLHQLGFAEEDEDESPTEDPKDDRH